MRKWLRMTGSIAAGLLLLALVLWGLMQTSVARNMLAKAIGDAASSATTKVEILGLEGWLPNAPRIRRIRLADKSGVWLELDGVALDWNALGLIWGNIGFDRLSVSEARWLRYPEGGGKEDNTSGTSLPRFYLSRLEVKTIRVAKAVAGSAATLSLLARADLRDPETRAVATLSLRQLEGGARVEGDMEWNPQANTLRLNATAIDRAGGFLTKLARLPPDAPLSIRLVSSGTLDDWRARLDASVGAAAHAAGVATIRRDGAWHRLEAKIDARLAQVGPEAWQPFTTGTWTLDLAAARSGSGALRLDHLKLRSPVLVASAGLEGDNIDAPLRLEATTAALPMGEVSLALRAAPERAWSDAGGRIRFEGSITQRKATASFKGQLDPETLKAELELAPTDLQGLDLGKGRLALKARLDLSRTSDAVSIEGDGTIDGLNLDDRMADSLLRGRADISFAASRDAEGQLKPARLTIRAARVNVDASVTGSTDVQQVAATGEIGGKPLALSAMISRNTNGSKSISMANLSIGRVSVSGDLARGRAGLSGRLKVVATNLADLSGFVDADLEGAASGTIDLVDRSGRTTAIVDLAGPRVRVDTVWLDGLQVTGELRDLLAAMVLQLDATATRADADGFLVERVAASGKGPLSALDVVVKARHLGGDLETSGRLKVNRSPSRISISTLTLRREGRELALAAPAAITINRGRVELPSIGLRAGTGTVRIDGTAGREMALSVEPRALPLWAIGLLTERLPVSGMVSGRIELKGLARERLSDFDVVFSALSAEGQSGGAPRDMTLAARGKTDRNGTIVTADLSGPRGARLRIAGRIPFSDTAAIALDLDGTVDLAIANAWLGTTGERATGRLTLTGRVGGRLSSPTVTGNGRLADGTFRSASAGFDLRAIEAVLDGNERRITLSRLTARTPNGGTFEAKGAVDLNRAAGYPVSLNATARGARLVSTSLTTLTADVEARMTGALAQGPMISGTVSIARWDINVPERLARPLTPIPVTHRNPPAGLVTQDDEADAIRGSALPFRLDVAVRAPREVFVRGQGIDAEFGGEARLTGSIDDPAVRGRFDLRRGAVTLLSQRVVLARGNVQFLGDTEPMLDIAGSVTKNGVSATVSVRGRAGDPQIALSSVPSLPQDEILARLLFSKRTTQLSPFEAAQLAQVLGRWSGLDTGPDLLERLRTTIGIDALTATTDETGTTSVTAGSYLGRGVYVGVSEAAGGSATVDVDLTDNIKLRGEAGATGTKVGVAAEWEY